MPRYPFTGAYERVITTLSYGPGVQVERNPDDPWPGEDPDGATVLLRPGDVLVTEEPLEFSHPEIEGTPVPPPPAPPADEPPADAPASTPASAPARSRQRSTTTTPDAGAAGAAV